MTDGIAAPKLPTRFWWFGAIWVAGATYATVRTLTGAPIPWTLWLPVAGLASVLAGTFLSSTRPKTLPYLPYFFVAAAILTVADVAIDHFMHR
jgi:hypothetical protein